MTYVPSYSVDRRELRQLLKDVDGMLYHGSNPDMFRTWAWGPCVDMRGGLSVVGETNVQVLMERLRGYEKDYRIERAGHWGFGWTEHLTFRAREEPVKQEAMTKRLAELEQEFTKQAERMLDYERSGPPDAQSRDEFQQAFHAREQALLDEQAAILRQKERLEYVPTTVCAIVLEWQKDVQENCILDEDAYYREMHEGFLENIVDVARDVNDNAPGDWPQKVADWIRHHYPGEADPDGDQPAYPSRDVVDEALLALGYLDDASTADS